MSNPSKHPPELVSIRKQMLRLFREPHDLQLLMELRDEWQQQLEALQQQPLEPEVAQVVAKALGKLQAVASPPASPPLVQLSGEDQRKLYLGKLTQAVEEF
ncbi:hypothetical protein [Hymenobacter yonginensis]|uniref:Tetrapyrrole biosynthesis glutamyl-tRNA reductase dimerisation domain-containing protein n=1 Tax=Hymenobacter yonginensis TaxID=748197 RepID=A0ABY7PTP9_9BACT|nr:hypothetical protein [Hymenobacter yonginensis]WBO86274.1 hypothetical protein O9Z63_08425 [Hymenobacter yonginensis]